jgi:hypothetical protein
MCLALSTHLPILESVLRRLVVGFRDQRTDGGVHMRGRWIDSRMLVGVLTILLAAAGVGSGPAAQAHAAAAGKLMSTRYLLNHLPVRSPHYQGYQRSKFTLWTSHPDGCNTRYKVLIRDAVRNPHIGAGCYLTDGKWVSPYDGYTTTNPTKIQIDHVVALGAAWGAGAWKWNSNTRERFANDLGTRYDLLAVSAHANESKGDDGPDAYLPPKASFDCRYMTDYTAVLWRWHLSIDRPELRFLRSHLHACGWPSIREPKRPAVRDHGTKRHHKAHHHACTRSSSGSCIAAGEFCPQSDYGHYGYDAHGDRLQCTGDRGHPHWERP